MSKTTTPTDLQRKIIQYAKEHPGCPQTEIARETGASISYTSGTLVEYGLTPKRKPEGNPSKTQTAIIALKKSCPDMSQVAIAKKLKCGESTVSLAITTFLGNNLPRVRPKSYHKKKLESGPFAIRPCLKCGGDHQSTWVGDRICPRCKGLHNEEYIDAYYVSMGRKSSGGYRA